MEKRRNKRRPKEVIEAEKYRKAVARFWRENPLAVYDRQWRYLRNCGHWVDPLTFPFTPYQKGDICRDEDICRSYRPCAICDSKKANVYSWDGYICIGCARRINAANAMIRHCDEIEEIITQLRRAISAVQKGAKDQRGPAPVPVRDDGKGDHGDNRRENGNDSRQAGSADQ